MSEKISQDKIKVIKNMTENGFCQKDIAQEIGVGVTTVLKYQKMLGVKARGYSTEAFNLKKIPEHTASSIIAKYKDGMTYREISEFFGVSTTSVRNILRKNNIPKRGYKRKHYIHSGECDVVAEELRVVLAELNNIIPENLFKRNVNIAVSNAIRLLKEESVE